VRARFEEDCGINFALVTEYLPISLSDLRRRGPMMELQARPLVGGVLEALVHIHARGLAHQDIKISNIMLKTRSGPVCIIDFGLAESVDAPFVKRACPSDVLGTPGYIAPEHFNPSPQMDRRAADVYSTAIVFYNLLSSRCAFSGRTQDEILERNRRGQVFFGNVEKSLSRIGQGALRAMLQNPPRPTAEECLAMDWFTKSPEELGLDKSARIPVDWNQVDASRSHRSPSSSRPLPVLRSLTNSDCDSHEDTLAMPPVRFPAPVLKSPTPKTGRTVQLPQKQQPCDGLDDSFLVGPRYGKEPEQELLQEGHPGCPEDDLDRGRCYAQSMPPAACDKGTRAARPASEGESTADTAVNGDRPTGTRKGEDYVELEWKGVPKNNGAPPRDKQQSAPTSPGAGGATARKSKG
jgi:serine/threonine protein kinase